LVLFEKCFKSFHSLRQDFGLLCFCLEIIYILGSKEDMLVIRKNAVFLHIWLKVSFMQKELYMVENQTKQKKNSEQS